MYFNHMLKSEAKYVLGYLTLSHKKEFKALFKFHVIIRYGLYIK